jgi:hypothetical protein
VKAATRGGDSSPVNDRGLLVWIAIAVVLLICGIALIVS